MKSSSVPTNLICLAEITSAHGIRGQVKLKTYTQNPEDILSYGCLHDETGKPVQLKINTVKFPNQAVVTISGVSDRTHAEGLRGVKLYVDKSRLPDLNEDEFYHDQLVGLTVVNQQGDLVGEIKAIHNFGAGDFFDVKRVTGEVVTLAFRKESVLSVSVSENRMVIDEAFILTVK